MFSKSELEVLEILWSEGDMPTKDLLTKLNESLGWCGTKTLQVVRECIANALVEKAGPPYMYRALITKEAYMERKSEVASDKMIDESSDLLAASLLGGKKMTNEQIEVLRNLIKEFMI